MNDLFGGPTLYDVLGVEPDAPYEKIRAIYRLRSKTTYPIRPGEGDGERQREINEAKEILTDADKRLVYNKTVGVTVRPRALRPGFDLYEEASVPAQLLETGGMFPYTLKRSDPCRICWGEGCERCQGRGQIVKELPLDIVIVPGQTVAVVEHQGMVSDPGGPRGDLVIYLIPKR